MNRVKGLAFIGFSDYIEKRLGKSEIIAFAKTLPPDLARIVLEGPVKSSWYPRELYFLLMDEFARRYGGDNPSQVFRESAACNAERDLNTVYQFLLKFGYPGFVVGRAAVIWQNYYEGGRMEVVEKEKNRMTVRVYDDVYPVFMCDLVIGYGERATQLSGGTDARATHSICKHRGGPFCEFEIAWK